MLLNKLESKRKRIVRLLMRSTYFLAKNHIPHSTTYKELIELQVLNGDELLEKHLSEGPSNGLKNQDSVLECCLKRLIFGSKESLKCSLQESSYFSILAGECQDISTQEQLSICGRWLVNGKRKEHFLMVHHVHSKDASTIAEALLSFLQQRQLYLRRLIGQGYDGAATYAGKISGVHKQIQTSVTHAIYIHCSCYRLQLTLIQTAASVNR